MRTPRLIVSLLLGALCVSSIALAQAIPDPYADVDLNVLHTDKFNLDVGGMGQVLALGQVVDDPYKDNARVYLFLPKARLRLDGSYNWLSFNFQIALGGEDLVVSPNPGITLGLLDLAFNIAISPKVYLKVGQFLVPYGREQLTDPGFQDFADVSLEDVGFVVGRDVGAAIVARPGPMSLIAGVFTGGGRDEPPDHYLPERLGVPLLVARVGVGDLDADPFYLRQSELHPDHTKYAISAGGFYTLDSTVGHSTVLNVKSSDKSLLIDSAWNPFIAAKAPLSQGSYWQAEADAAVRMPFGGFWALAGEAQADYGSYSNGHGTVTMFGARVQGALVADPLQLAIRYAVLVPSDQFANGGIPITGNEPIHEITPSLSYYILGENLKVILDFPILIHVPVFTEPGVGQYVGSELPDQASVLATGGTVGRQNVAQGRLMLEGQF
jgi:hypothetical protein